MRRREGEGEGREGNRKQEEISYLHTERFIRDEVRKPKIQNFNVVVFVNKKIFELQITMDNLKRKRGEERRGKERKMR